VTEIRAARPADVPALTALHVQAFPGFFITRLGPRFVAELYRGFIHHPDAICRVACENGELVGVVAGPLRPGEFFGELLHSRGLRFALAAVPGLLRDPWNVGRRLLAAPFYRGEAPKQRDCAALISTICVSPAVSGGGVATALLDSFCMTAAARGARYVYLTTDRDANERVNAFYLRAGFAVESEVQRPGRRVMNRYLKDLRQT
jgi:ribosomal protein S18 acetylase RimI-like enzyme